MCRLKVRFVRRVTGTAGAQGNQKSIQKKKLPDLGPCLSQSINQEEMIDKSSEAPIRFDRVDNLCL